jgi:ParD-like antitoxin of type II bacterial toxin-antitoxin system
MGIVKIADHMHEELRKASVVMCRSINAQAEFWMKVGMLAEANPGRRGARDRRRLRSRRRPSSASGYSRNRLSRKKASPPLAS